jgi:hypothetical protein
MLTTAYLANEGARSRGWGRAGWDRADRADTATWLTLRDLATQALCLLLRRTAFQSCTRSACTSMGRLCGLPLWLCEGVDGRSPSCCRAGCRAGVSRLRVGCEVACNCGACKAWESNLAG